ncbi:PAS domain-containing protein [Hymenobacter sp. HSC-4F20]|uniref:PAS domain-containing sensor histidine kinase n=1 Tax=Hymenobacter sp. HSC-4F20 TaxID=2864135 RepID=UPI001C72F3E4|nr:PAS domain-containing protein [Hymenobacter sp. HSC-4F20]MBX0293087.1 PAS domain-containing protein [Hymenobacter sp. HSC-4F20]
MDPAFSLTIPVASPSLLPALLDLPDTGLVFCTPITDTVGQVPDLAFTYLNPAAQRLLQLPAQPAVTYRQWLGVPAGGSPAWYEPTLRTGEPARARVQPAATPLHLTAQRLDAGLLLSVQAAPAEPTSATKEPAPAGPAEPLYQQLQERRQMESVDAVLAGLQEYVYLFDLEGRFRYANQPLLALWGLTLEQAVGKNFHDLNYPQELAARLQAQIQHVISTQQSVSDETPYSSPVGETGYYEYTLVPLFAADGSVEAVGGRTQPVTERRRAEEALRRAHEQVVDILESTTDAFYALDADFRFTYVNQRAARLWGRDQAALIGRHYWTEFPGAVGSESYRQHHLVQQTGEPVHYETVSPLLGTWIDVLIYPGREGGLSVFFRDITARKQTEAALRTSEVKLAAVFDALPVGVGVFDVRGQLTLANPRMQRYLPNGIMPSRDETQHARWRAYYPDGQPLPRSEFPGARALRGEKVVPGTEMRYTQDDGQEVWTQVSSVPLQDNRGEVDGHITVIIDIDVRKRTGEALQASEQRQRALMENLPGGAVFVVDRDLRYQLAEGEALRAAGFAPADLLGRSVREVMPPDLWAQHEPYYRSALAGQAFAVELEAYGRMFLTRGVPLHNAAGQVDGALAVSYDITDRQQAETALRQSEERLQQALSIDTVGVIFFDLQGGIHDANAAFQRMSGYSRADFVSGRVRWDEVTPPEFMDATRRSQHELLTQGQNTPYEKQYIRPDGSRWWGLFAGKRLSTGECVEFVLDITKAKEVEQDLRASQQQLEAFNAQLLRLNTDLDTFIYTASHDLKAPITNIEGLIHALQAQLPAPVQHTYDVGPLLGMMQESVARFQRTIEQLSDVIKLQKQHAEPVAEVLLLPVLEDVRRDLRPVLAAAGAQVLLEVGPTARVCFSAKNLRSVVYNLLSNAVKYRHPARAPQVRISCQAQQGYTLLRVQDNGLGIEAGKHADLFQLFRRLHSHVPGTGIGLYMVKRMVDNAGGLIEVESEVGVGSCFTVYFPA